MIRTPEQHLDLSQLPQEALGEEFFGRLYDRMAEYTEAAGMAKARGERPRDKYTIVPKEIPDGTIVYDVRRNWSEQDEERGRERHFARWIVFPNALRKVVGTYTEYEDTGRRVKFLGREIARKRPVGSSGMLASPSAADTLRFLAEFGEEENASSTT